MANENIDPNSIQHPDHPDHHTWLQSLVEKIQNLDTEFPLSGGETDEDFERATHVEQEANLPDDVTTRSEQTPEHTAKEPKEHHTIMDNLLHKIHNLDTEFPLSGGEE
jgi:hypothetical protein